MSTHTSEIRKYQPAMMLDTVLSRGKRRVLRVFVLAFTVASGGIALFMQNTEVATVFFSQSFYAGLFFVSLSILIALYLISFFYNTLYYRGLDSLVREEFTDTNGLTYEVATLMHNQQNDLTAAFLTSTYGQTIIMRLGVDLDGVGPFLNSVRKEISVTAVPIPEHGFVSLESVGLFVYERDEAFRNFITAHGKYDVLYKGTLSWVSRSNLEWKYQTKWWSRDNLRRIPSIGRELSYGIAYSLKRYTKFIGDMTVFSLFTTSSEYIDTVREKVQTALSKERAANALLVGEPGIGKIDVLVALGREMDRGVSTERLNGKRLYVFDQDAFIASHNSKKSFEFNFISLLTQAEKAGNIILVLDKLPTFITSAAALQVNVPELLDRFLVSQDIQIVATADPASFHDRIETDIQLASRFETILIAQPSLERTIRILQGVAEGQEARKKVFFTYPSIVAIAEDSDRYITEGVLPDKAVNFLMSVLAKAEAENVQVIRKEFVDKSAEAKTGIPIGSVSADEKDKLLNLEERLGARVIGQPEALTAVASAMRRARAGVQSEKRPLGSFLFLGSTGVGKTETAKALAYEFFGSDESMTRVDMSEYSADDVLGRLIGDSDSAGAFSSLLREHPYSVVLLDEFEKASPEVHNLFLQILDEGMFTDGRGQTVNARNTIIIATSNAGSNIIWEMANRGENPSESKEKVVDMIIGQGIFKPELVNRFDATVVFKVLEKEDQLRIAGLMLEKLKERIIEKGYQLHVDDMLVQFVAENGFNPEFGARPMRRFIQDAIEEKIATKIISGGLSPGETIRFLPDDLYSGSPVEAS